MYKFFAIDGNDGSGKNTQAQMLVEYLKSLGRKTLFLSFPRYEETLGGKLLKKSLAGEYGDFIGLDSHWASLPYAIDRYESRAQIVSSLANGTYVICDRWVSANQIHQSGKFLDLEKRREFLHWLNHLEYGVLKLPRPTMSIYLDVPLEVSLELLQKKNRDSAENNKAYLENSVEAARWLIAEEPNHWIRIRCAHEGVMRTREDIQGEIIKQLVARGLLTVLHESVCP